MLAITRSKQQPDFARILKPCGSRWLTLLILLLALFCTQSGMAASWAGRALTDVLKELRTDGVILVYSSQLVTPDLKVGAEPSAPSLGERLREILKPFGLTTKPLGNGINGFVIVRLEPAAVAANPAQSSTDVPPLEEVAIYGSVYSIVREEAPHQEVSGRTLENIAGAEEDALQAIHNFPGTASSAVSALTHVRGGSADETLIQFDGLELYDPVHLKDFQGLFGVLDPELIQSLNFFSGGFSVRYGNHTSGMIDIEPRRTPKNNLLSASTLYTRALSSGDFNDGRGDWLIGYRHSTIPEVLQQLRRNIGDPDFEDFVGRVSYDWDMFRVVIGMLRLNDDLLLFTPANSEQTTAYFHDAYLWLRLEHSWNDSLTSQFQISQASLRAQRDGSVNADQISTGMLSRKRDTVIDTALIDWSYTQNTTRLQWGARMDRGSLRYAYSGKATFFQPLSSTFNLPSGTTRSLAGDPQGSLYSAYASMRVGVRRWTGELGLRWDDYEYLADGKVLSPRFNLQYALTQYSNLRFSVGRYVQARGPNNLDIANAILSSSAPETSTQFVTGFEQLFSGGLTFRAEVYAKRNEHVRPYSENVLDIITLVPELKIDRALIVPQQSSARGLELSLTSSYQGPFNWWANFTWSRVRDRIGGVDAPRSWDQPYSFSAGGIWADAHWKHSATFSWHSGWPFTPLQIEQTANGDAAVLGARNTQRFSDYSSVDIRSEYQVPISGGALEVFLELRNAFNQANGCCREIRITQTAANGSQINVEQKAWIGVVPLVGASWRF